jgi:flagellar hook-basal body complex protein FliE
MSSVSPIHFPAMIQLASLQQASAQPGSGFQDALQAAVGQVENSKTIADSAIQKFVSGQDQELHSTILATQNAELQFEMLMQVRNKVVSAYEEIMKMQL